MARRFLGKYDAYKGRWLKFGKRYALLILVLFLAMRFLVGISWVSGDSMYPTLKSGNAVVYFRPGNTYHVGDIVSVKMAYGEYYIKRVVAVAGDTVDLIDVKLYVNGLPESGGWGRGDTWPQESTVEYPLTIPEGKLFAVGDNRPISIDSRTFGPVALSQIRGRILFHMGK